MIERGKIVDIKIKMFSMIYKLNMQQCAFQFQQSIFLVYNNLFNKKQKKGQMDNFNQPPQNSFRPPIVNNPQFMQGGFPQPQFGTGLGGFPGQPNQMMTGPSMGQPFMNMAIRGQMPPTGMPASLAFPEQQQKKREFARGLYVTGFENTLTVEMLLDYFSKVKSVHGIKLPKTKLNENKGFAFIYFGSEDDANFVKMKLDRTVILRNQIRVTRTVISDNLSKMMFRLKAMPIDEQKKAEIELFNEEKLESFVGQIVEKTFAGAVEVNKIIIPSDKKGQSKLKYARVFFYISDINSAVSTAKRIQNSVNPLQQKPQQNNYDAILNVIADTLNTNIDFNKYVSAELYEYTKKNQTNVLHLKGLKILPNEDPAALANDIKKFIGQLNPQLTIVNCFAAIHEKVGAWANVSFSSPIQAQSAYEQLKNLRPMFRDVRLYGSLKNLRDNRTLVMSVLRKDVNEAQVKKFLTSLAENSKLTDPTNNTRKFDYFSFNIIEQKTFFVTNEGKPFGAGIEEIKNVPTSWREQNTVPRRIIVHFIQDVSEVDIRDLTNDIRNNPFFKEIFLEDDRKLVFRVNHQKGHIKGNIYVPHILKKTQRQKKHHQRSERPINPRQPRQGPLNNRRQPGQTGPTHPRIDFAAVRKGPPQISRPQQQGPLPQMGQQKYQPGPSTLVGGGQISQPIGNIMGQIPMKPSIGQPMMGMVQPMIGQQMMGQPMMRPIYGMGKIIPQMGQSIPQMGQQIPQMGQQIPQMGNLRPQTNSIPSPLSQQEKDDSTR